MGFLGFCGFAFCGAGLGALGALLRGARASFAWDYGRNLVWGGALQGVTELEERERCKDDWWNEVVDELRRGELSEENWRYLHGKPVEGCRLTAAERESRRRVIAGPGDPRLGEEKFRWAAAIVANNDPSAEVLQTQARGAAGEKVQGARGASLRAQECDKAARIRWLQYHDRDTENLSGMLPLAVGMRVVLADHLDRAEDKLLLRGSAGRIHSWVWKENDLRPTCVYVKFDGAAWPRRGAGARPLPGLPRPQGLEAGRQAQEAGPQDCADAAAAGPGLRDHGPQQPGQDAACGASGLQRRQADRRDLWDRGCEQGPLQGGRLDLEAPDNRAGEGGKSLGGGGCPWQAVRALALHARRAGGPSAPAAAAARRGGGLGRVQGDEGAVRNLREMRGEEDARLFLGPSAGAGQSQPVGHLPRLRPKQGRAEDAEAQAAVWPGALGLPRLQVPEAGGRLPARAAPARRV